MEILDLEVLKFLKNFEILRNYSKNFIKQYSI